MRKLFYILLFALGFTSCDKIEESCKIEKPASALVVEFPDSIEVGTIHPLKIQYVLDNDCGGFGDFNLNITGNLYEITLNTIYEGCNCKMEFQEDSTEFELRIDDPGIYEVKFWLSDVDFDTYSLKVYD